METESTVLSADAFQTLAEESFDRLPVRFAEACRNVVVLVEDFPADDVCREMALHSPYDLLGLYDGVDIVTRSLDGWDGPPDVILLYRRPILDFASTEGHSPGDVITHVLIHEIGHHMGFSDDDMTAIESEADVPPINAVKHHDPD